MPLFMLFLLILLNAFFSASEMALISVNDNRIRQAAENGDKKAKKVQKLLSEPSAFLATIQIGVTLAGFLASALAAAEYAQRLSDYIVSLGWNNPPLVHALSVTLITLLLSYVSLVLGELVPKRLAMQHSQKFSYFAAPILIVLGKIALPFVKLLTFSTNIFVRLFGGNPNASEEEVTEEEIRMMVDVGQERGAIEDIERDLINNIFDFNDKKISDIMTHRTDIVGLPVDATLEETMQVINTERFSRIPVFEDSLDNIVGILHIKDMFEYLMPEAPEFNISAVMRKPFFVPESRDPHELLNDLRKTKNYIGVVIDEYGGTAGIITIEDLLEEIVGNIFDEYDDDEHEYDIIDENTYNFDGTIDIEEFMEITGASLELDEEIETLGGFIISHLGRIPDDGEQPEITTDGYKFKVQDVEEKRIMRVMVTRIPIASEQEDKEGKVE